MYWRRKWQPTPVFLPGKFHGQRSLVGYSPWSCKVRHDLATKQKCIYVCVWKWKCYSLSHVQLYDSMDYGLPGSSVHGIFQLRILEWVAISFPNTHTHTYTYAHGILQARILEWVFQSLFQGIFPTQGSNPGLLHCRWILCCLSHQGNPRILKWLAIPFSRGSSWHRDQTRVSCIAGRFFTIWGTREDPSLCVCVCVCVCVYTQVPYTCN